MKEASDPKLDGFLTAEEIIDLMMQGWGFKTEYGGGFDCNSYYITKTAGRVRGDTLSRLRSEGWITETGPNCYKVTEAGQRLFNHEKTKNLSKRDELLEQIWSEFSNGIPRHHTTRTVFDAGFLAAWHARGQIEEQHVGVFEAGPVLAGASLNITIVADGAIRSITDNNGNIWVKQNPLKTVDP